MVHVEDPNGPHFGRIARSDRRDNSTKVQFDAEIEEVLQGPVSNTNCLGSVLDAPPSATSGLSPAQLRQSVEIFVEFLRQERARYYPQGQAIGPKSKAFLARFFDPALLDLVRVVKMTEARIPNPPFYAVAREMGYQNLPDLQHQATVTFLDVVVFNEKITDRALFHGLVHATQVQILGVGRYAELFVRGFLKAKSYFMVPIKAHAFALDCQFAENRERGFSVETEVMRWLEEGRYQ
jgi:hypothetical protein